MQLIITSTKDFEKSLKLIKKTRKSIIVKIWEFYDYIYENWLDNNIYNRFDIKSLWDWYFRVKFIPFRIIIRHEKNKIIFKKLFKRKWKWDYRQFN